MGEIHGAVASGSTYNPLTAGSTTSYGLAPDATNWLEWNMPPYLAGSASAALTTGTIYGFKCPWRQPSTQALTAVGFNVNAAGTGLSGSLLGVYDMNGSKLGEANADTAFATVNFNSVALAVSAASMAAAEVIAPYIYVAFLAVGTTGPAVMRGANATASQLQFGQSGNKLMFTNLGSLTAQSALPASITMTNNGATAVSAQVAVK